MPFSFDTKNIIILLVGLINIVYGLMVYLRNKKSKTNCWFFSLVLAVTFWIVSIIAYRGFQEIETVILWARILYLSATLIPFAFLGFTFIFPEEEFNFKSWQKYLLPLPMVIIAFISLFPNGLIRGVEIIAGEENKIIFNQYLHLIYALYIIGYFSWGYVILFKKYLASAGVMKIQLAYVIVGILASTMIGVTTNLILPLLGIFTFNWLGQATIIIMIAFISYAILKYHLFNIKLIAAELLTFAIWVAIFFEVVAADTAKERLFEMGIFILVVILGILLIRSFLKLEAANEKLRQLDRLKSEFLSFASHQVKAPMTIIKGYSSLISEGSFGRVPEKVKETSVKIREVTDKTIRLVTNFLDLRKIEEGKMEYQFTEINIVDLVKGIVEELTIMARNKSLDLSSKLPKTPIKIKADKEKLRQVILNLVENAIKYTEKGFVNVELKEENDSVLIFVSDSGVGISKKLLPNLFQRFSRDSKTAKEIRGTGLGLYIAKVIINAHHGKIWAASKGENSGSKFFVRLTK
jgi:signal transduction histidine kinase